MTRQNSFAKEIGTEKLWSPQLTGIVLDIDRLEAPQYNNGSVN